MIISNKYRYLFISMPKTGTHTMYNVLSDNFAGERYGEWHESVPPDSAIDYFKFATVRNPYTRFASAWYFVSNKNGEYIKTYERLMGHEMEIIYFLKWLNTEREKLYYNRDPRGRLRHLSTILLPQHVNVRQRLKGVKIDRFIKMENLLDEVNNLPFVEDDMKLPHIPKNHSMAEAKTYMKWDELKTPEITTLVNQLMGDDFEMFGYDVESP